MKKAYSGQVTVFLSLILICVCGLICGLLESARTAGARCYLQTAAGSSMDSLFSQYHRKLWEEYRIFGLEHFEQETAAEEFSGEHPSQKQEITLILSLDNENVSEVQIELYRYDGEHCLAVVDGESISLVERSAVVDLIEAVHAIVLD